MGLQMVEDRPVTALLEYWALAVWAVGLMYFLLRFLSLGSSINAKYQHAPVLLAEQVCSHARLQAQWCAVSHDSLHR